MLSCNSLLILVPICHFIHAVTDIVMDSASLWLDPVHASAGLCVYVRATVCFTRSMATLVLYTASVLPYSVTYIWAITYNWVCAIQVSGM